MGTETDHDVRCRTRLRCHWALNQIENDKIAWRRAAAAFREDVIDIERRFEVVRQVWEMAHAGKGATEIQRALRTGKPSWMWRSLEQVKYMMRPGDWKFNDNEGQGNN